MKRTNRILAAVLAGLIISTSISVTVFSQETPVVMESPAIISQEVNQALTTTSAEVNPADEHTAAAEDTTADEAATTEDTTADEAAAAEEATADEAATTEDTTADEAATAEDTTADEAATTEDTTADEAATTEDTTADEAATTEDTTADEAATAEDTTADEAATADEEAAADAAAAAEAAVVNTDNMDAEALVELFSLKPLDQFESEIELRDLPFSQTTIKGSELVAKINAGMKNNGTPITENDKLVLRKKYSTDSYSIVEQTSDITIYDLYFSPIEIIAGSAKQLDATNRRYTISVAFHPMIWYDSIEFYVSIYNQNADTSREFITSITKNIPIGQEVNEDNYLQADVAKSENIDITQPLYLSLAYPWNDYSDYTITAYEGFYLTEPATGHIPKLLDQNMETADQGYLVRLDEGKMFTLFYKFNGKLVGTVTYGVKLNQTDYRTYMYGLDIFKKNDTLDYWENAVWRNRSSRSSRETFSTYEEEVWLNDNVKASDNFAISLNNNVSDENGRRYWLNTHDIENDIQKVVVGHYAALEDAADQADIKSDIFSTTKQGYETTLSDPLLLTIFTENHIYQYTVVAHDGIINKNPVSADEFDNYMTITGAEGIAPENIYTMWKRDDAGAKQFGYQVLLIDDPAADLSALKPTFQLNNGASAYVKSVLQESGVSQQDFSQGAVHYMANTSAQEGSIAKDYYVTFAKAHNAGAKLFVVVDGNEPDKREIFFNNYAGYYHDVFLANIGSSPLTGLKVELKNAKNIALDDYWTVGGDGNSTLDAFSSAASNGANGYLSNIAKIRLNSAGNGTDISGQLVITADGQEPYTIDLTGEYGNPSVISEDPLKNAVLYVPYQMLLESNNRYQWNKPRYTLNSGKLPKGISLLTSGELYGTPTETGTFSFEVAMHNSSPLFTSWTEYTITVLPNSDINVASQVDTGYEITKYVPRYIPKAEDYVFTTNGEFALFADFWLDGKRLIRDTDYKVEEGSTVVTLLAQTFEKAGNGTHTIAAEFKSPSGDYNTVFRAAQNYSLGISPPSTLPPANPNVYFGSATSTTDDNDNGGGGGAGGMAGLGRQLRTAVSSATKTLQTTLTKLLARVKNQNLFTLEELKKLAADAAAQGKTPVLNADTMHSIKKEVEVRVSVNPALATTDLNLGASTSNKGANRTRKIYEKFYSNTITAVIDFEQEGGFGQLATVCVRVPEGTKLADLKLYAYNAQTNRYGRITDPNMFIDQNRYLHFHTAGSVDVVISQGALQRK